MKRKIALGLVCLLLCALLGTLVCSCGDKNATDMPYEKGDDAEYRISMDSADGEKETERKIIKTVEETIQTAKYDECIAGIKDAVKKAGGYISSSSYSGETYYDRDHDRYAYFVLRVPAGKLDDFTSALGSLGVVADYEEREEDVTLAYVDVESRIAVLEAEEAALTEMLAKATDTDQLLSIRKQLNQTQQELASLKAQKRSYDNLVSYSTIRLNVREVERERTQKTGFFAEIGEKFTNSLSDIGSAFRAIAVWLFGNILHLILWGGIITGIVFFVRFLVRRKNKKKHTPPENK